MQPHLSSHRMRHANTMKYDSIRAVIWENGVLKLLDQRLLPHEQVYLEYEEAESVAAAIKQMVVRGAPAIGVTAAYAVVLAARHRFAQHPTGWRAAMER